MRAPSPTTGAPHTHNWIMRIAGGTHMMRSGRDDGADLSVSERFCFVLNELIPLRRTRQTPSPLDAARSGYEAGDRILDQYRPHLSLEGRVVLDAGCGFGGKTVFYSEQGPRYTVGVDFDSIHVEHARSFAAERAASDVGFTTADLSALPFSGSTFDVILLHDVVEHIRRPALRHAFCECRRVLKSGGIICLQFPPWTSYNASHLSRYISIPWCHLVFSEETLINVTKLYDPEPRIGKLSYLDHFRELNKIDLDEFIALARECNLHPKRVERRMIKRIDILRRLPVLRDYLTTRFVAILTPVSPLNDTWNPV